MKFSSFKMLCIALVSAIIFSSIAQDATAQVAQDTSDWVNVQNNNYVMMKRASIGTYKAAVPDYGAILTIGGLYGDSTKAPLYLYPVDTGDVPTARRKAGMILFQQTDADSNIYYWNGALWKQLATD